MPLSNQSRITVARGVGFAATVILLLAVLVPPFVGSETLVAKVQLSLSSLLQAVEVARLPTSATLLDSSGFLLILLGVLFGLIFFGVRFRPRLARVGVVLSVVGLLWVTFTLFDFSGGVTSRIFIPVQVGPWSSLSFFGTGYFIAWLAIVASAIASRTRVHVVQTPRPVQPPRVAYPSPTVTRTIQTGYAALDNMLYGGLPLGSSIVLTAPPCDEKNLILARFVERNLSLGHKCIFISTSLDRVQALLPKYRANLSVIICNPHAEALAASYPDVARLPSVDSLTALNLEYDKAMAKIGSGVGAVLCLEILDDVLLAHHGETRRWLMDILGRSKARQITTLATFNQAMHPPQESQAVLETFDGHIDLYEAEVQVRPKLIQVKKLGGRQFLDTEVRVDKDKI